MKAVALGGLTVVTILAAAAPSEAQRRDPARAASVGERIVRVTVFGNDPCPRGRDGEIVICGRRPSQERYRIPEQLRDDAAADDPENVSWAARNQSLEYAGRTGIQSCSPVGAGGQTGCLAELIRAARGDRRVGEGEPGR